jgi:hypothetical protein
MYNRLHKIRHCFQTVHNLTNLRDLPYAHISRVCPPRLAVAGPPDSRAAKGKPSRLGDVAYGLATECRP